LFDASKNEFSRAASDLLVGETMMFQAACLMSVVSASTDGHQISTDKLTQNQTQHFALTKLAESAAQLLRYGVTPTVLKFTGDTLAEITGTVLPEITQAHERNVLSLQARHRAFEHVKTIYQTDNDTLIGLRGQEQVSSTQHLECRATERTNCGTFTDCANVLKGFWDIFQNKKNALDATHTLISGTSKMCEANNFPPSRTNKELYSWEHRTDFKTYTDQGQEYFEAKDIYQAKRPLCETDKTLLNSTTSQCNTLKQELEQRSCASKREHSEALAKFNAAWALAKQELNATEVNIRALEEDRKVEFKTIKSIECLLNYIVNSGGMPCDEETGNAQVAACKSTEINSAWLDIEYKPEPAKPDDLASAPHPCNDDFHAQELYGNLTNHCFSNLPTSWQQVEPVWVLPDSSPSTCQGCGTDAPSGRVAWTDEGCPSKNAMVGQDKSIDDSSEKYYVRCCPAGTNNTKVFMSAYGHCHAKLCDQNITGDSGCRGRKTYAEALRACHNQGLTLCTKTQLESDQTCDTGCDYDTKRVWTLAMEN